MRDDPESARDCNIWDKGSLTDEITRIKDPQMGMTLKVDGDLGDLRLRV